MTRFMEYASTIARDRYLSLKIATSVVSAIIFVSLAYKLVAFLHMYWWTPRRIVNLMEKQGVRGPPPQFMLGNLPERARMREQAIQHDMHGITHDIVGRLMPDYVHWSAIYGKRFLFWWGTEPRLTVSEPEQIRDLLSSKHVQCLGRSDLQRKGVNDFIGKGLLMANGDAWAHQRRLVAPAFHLEKLKGQVGRMVESTSQMLSQWNELIINSGNGSSEIEVCEHMSRLAGDVIARTEFGSSYDKGKIIFSKLNELQKLSTKSGRPTRIHGKRIQALKKEVEKSLLSIIEARRETMNLQANHRSSIVAGNHDGHDLLDQMLSEISNARKEQPKFRYTARCLIDECKTFFFTGHDTTSLLLTWTIMLLASNPSWQDRARQEVVDVCQDHPPHADILCKLKVLGMILFESLRLYTPATLLARQAFSDIKVGDLLIPKGLSIWVPVLAIHHDKAIWGQDANEFNPERFAEGASKASKHHHPMAYLPFSFGPRNCVGQNFAIIEAKVVLAMILSRFRFHLSTNYRHAPIFVLTLKPKHGVPIIIQSSNQ